MNALTEVEENNGYYFYVCCLSWKS